MDYDGAMPAAVSGDDVIIGAPGLDDRIIVENVQVSVLIDNIFIG